jgi:all-trans-retinol dehydrogenase (NAD+)
MLVITNGISFIIEVFFLIIEFFKCIFWTCFYFVFPPTQKYVRNEIVLITGSAKGLGRQIAIEFAKRGSILILIDRDDNENNKTVELLKATGLNSKRIYAYHCDLT